MPRRLRIAPRRFWLPAAVLLCSALLSPRDVLAGRPATADGPLGLGGPVQPVKEPSAVYIVKLKRPGAATYKGDASGYAATKPGPGNKLNRSSGSVESYVKYLETTQDRLLTEIGAADRKIYSYRYALNGFAARLSAAEASRLAQHPEVDRIWADTEQHVQADDTAVFLGLLDQDGGLRADLKLRGDGIIIGVIDSGIAPNHPSMRDYEEQIPRVCTGQWAQASWLGLILCHAVRSHPPTVQTYDPPEGFQGVCQAGDGFTADDCNNKLVGARYYIDGFLARNDLDPNEYLSPKDADGHGTHIATLVAGNPVTASLFGTRIGEISGVAPRARVAVYKACWLKPGDTRASCATSDLAQAIDDAVADGVDIINYSIGSLETDLTAPDDLALLNALDAGVLSVVAAGNDGPTENTIGSPSSDPWVVTAAASTQTGSRFEEAIEVTAPADLAGRLQMREGSFTAQLSATGPAEGSLVLVDDGQTDLGSGAIGTVRDACEDLQNGADLAGNIALIERGGCTFQDKLQRAEAAGATAAVVYNNNGAPIVMNGDAGSVDIPAVMIGTADGQRLVDALAAADAVEVRLAKGVFLERRETGNQMSDFSSRGPDLSDADIVKPDLTAPGVDILGGNTPEPANGVRGELFQYLSGTSQAAPQVTAIAALLKEAHPDMTPGQLKSALMTTAYQGVTEADGETPARPFDMGAGHVDANRAIDPGLVYDTGFLDHAAYLCGLVERPFSDSDCSILAAAGYSFASRDLNLPSFGISEMISGDTVVRRVTNVGPPATYQASVNAPPGIDVVVDPPSLSLGTGETADFTVSFTNGGAARDEWQFGRLQWNDGTHTVGSPLAVRPVTLRAPAELFFEGADGSAVLPVDFGYDGQYFPGVHGLHPPFLDAAGFVDDDVTRQFSFRTGNGVTAHDIRVDPGDIFLRVALFDELTDGADDLDLYLFYCPTTDNCTQIGQSGGFTSDEKIDLIFPPPGFYRILVHGFQTDQVSGGPGANYELLAWALGTNDGAGNLQVEYTGQVADGDRWDFVVDWGPLDSGTRYLGGITHQTPFDPATGFYALTLIDVDVP
jgi:hypothetical protein